jgi:hypothetical protein
MERKISVKKSVAQELKDQDIWDLNRARELWQPDCTKRAKYN